MQELNCPEAIDVLSLQFKLHRKVRVYEGCALPEGNLELVAAASLRDLLFVACPDASLHVFPLRPLVCESGELRRVVPLPGVPLQLALSHDHSLLAVCLRDQLLIYQTADFANQDVLVVCRSALPPAGPLRLLWNPCQGDLLAACCQDGSVSLYRLQGNTLTSNTKMLNARCISWSPKGKQLVCGSADGQLTQYKPDLSVAKSLPAPRHSLTTLSLHWISNYQFLVVYMDLSNPTARPFVGIVNTPKSAPVTFINYEDICYSSGGLRAPQYYLTHNMLPWGVMVVSSANSMEAGVLGSSDQLTWQQWIQVDEARAELPLTASRQEGYPVGVAYDDSAHLQLTQGENEVLPHMPLLHMLSHEGTLVSFFCLNLSPGALQLCAPPSFPVSLPQHLLTTSASKAAPPPAPLQLHPQPPQAAHITQQDISFQNLVTSTPTHPKSSGGGLLAHGKPVAHNLFGAPSAEKDVAGIEKLPSSFVKPAPPAATPAPAPAPTVTFTAKAEPSQQAPPPAAAVPPTPAAAPTPPQPSAAAVRKMLLKEIHDFQQELSQLLHKCRNIDTKIGTKEEMREISCAVSVDQKSACGEWGAGRGAGGLSLQVSALKQGLIRACALLAEANVNPQCWEVSQLDPVSWARLVSIRQNLHYTETQLKQLTKGLDEQWDGFQDRCKKKLMALKGLNDDIMQMPTLDAVYEPLARQQVILARQRAQLRTLHARVRRSTNTQSASTTHNSSASDYSDSLSTLTKNLLNVSIKSTADGRTGQQTEDETAASREASAKKLSALRGLLGGRPITHIKPLKTEPPPLAHILEEARVKQEAEEAVRSSAKPAAPEPAAQTSTHNNHNTFMGQTICSPAAPRPQVSVPQTIFSRSPAPASVAPPTPTPTPAAQPHQPPSTAASTQPFLFKPSPVTSNKPFSFVNTSVKAPPQPATTSNNASSGVMGIRELLTMKSPVASQAQAAATQGAAAQKTVPSNFSGAFSVASMLPSLQSTQAAPQPQTKVLTSPQTSLLTSPAPPAAPIISTPAPSLATSESMKSIFGAATGSITFGSSLTISPVLNKPTLATNVANTPAAVSLPATPVSSSASSPPPASTSSALTITAVSTPPAAASVPNTGQTTITPVAAAHSVTPPSATPAVASPPAMVTPPSFGASPSPVTASPTPAVTPPASVVATPAPAAATPAPVITTPPPSSTAVSPANIFAQAAAGLKPAGSPPSAFDAQAKPASVFGSPSSFTPVATQEASAASSLFGNANASLPAAPVFGGGETMFGSTSFGSALSFGSPPATNMFGAPSPSPASPPAFGGSAFGQSGGSVFGGSSTFGQPQSSTFGGAPAFGGFGSSSSSSVFGAGASGGSLFGSPAPPAESSIFGSPAAAASQQSAFGASPTGSVFGSSTFGSKPASSFFGQSSFGSGGFGSFSSGQQNVEQTGFGVPGAFSKPAGSFGASPAFGGAPLFGGSPVKAFGVPEVGPFGAPQQQSSTFENLATQGTLTFGNLAQQTQQPIVPQPAFQASSAFSTWR